MISRTRPSTEGSCTNSKSSRNSTKGVGWRASASIAWAAVPAWSAVSKPSSQAMRAAASFRPARKRGASLSARSSVSQAVPTPSASKRARLCSIAVVLPNPAGARTSTSLAAPAWQMRSHTAERGTWVGKRPGGSSLAASAVLSGPVVAGIGSQVSIWRLDRSSPTAKPGATRLHVPIAWWKKGKTSIDAFYSLWSAVCPSVISVASDDVRRLRAFLDCSA